MTDKPLLISYSRFSSPEQKKGDSLRRQTESAREYAKANGFTFDQNITDEGISAFKGKHASEGGFSKFLELVRAGKIPKGSMLYVENLDRISRDFPDEALWQLLGIIRAGITVYTAMDGQTYNTETIRKNTGSLYQSIGAIQTAHGESKNKSKRQKAIWKNKRKMALEEKRPVSAICPAWVTLNEKTRKFELIPARVELIQRIYHMSVQGYGENAIAKKFNAEGIRPWGKGAGWTPHYIRNLLTNPAVTGQYRPTILNTAGKRVPSEPIDGYYPAAIDTDLFFKVKELRGSRGGTPGRCNMAKNLFSHIVKCGYCGGSANSSAKTRKKTGGKLRYLCCENGRTGNKQCNVKPRLFPLHELEKAFLTLCGEIKPSDILDTKSEKAVEITALENKAAAIRAAIQEKDRAILNYTTQLEKTNSPALMDLMAANLEKALTAKTELEKALEKITGDITTLKTQETAVEGHLNAISELFERLDSPEHEEKTRYKLRQVIRQLVDKIMLFPDGMHDQYFSISGKTPGLIPVPDITDDKKQIREYIKENTGRDTRAAIIFFKTGSARAIYYNPRHGYYLGAHHDQEKTDQDREAVEQITRQEGSFMDRFHSALDYMANKPEPEPERIIYNPDPGLSALLNLEDRIRDMKASGIPHQAIADKLNTEGHVTATGKPWTFSNVSRICNRK